MPESACAEHLAECPLPRRFTGQRFLKVEAVPAQEVVAVLPEPAEEKPRRASVIIPLSKPAPKPAGKPVEKAAEKVEKKPAEKPVEKACGEACGAGEAVCGAPEGCLGHHSPQEGVEARGTRQGGTRQGGAEPVRDREAVRVHGGGHRGEPLRGGRDRHSRRRGEPRVCRGGEGARGGGGEPVRSEEQLQLEAKEEEKPAAVLVKSANPFDMSSDEEEEAANPFDAPEKPAATNPFDAPDSDEEGGNPFDAPAAKPVAKPAVKSVNPFDAPDSDEEEGGNPFDEPKKPATTNPFDAPDSDEEGGNPFDTPAAKPVAKPVAKPAKATNPSRAC